MFSSDPFIGPFIFIFSICAIVGYIVSIILLCRACDERGHSEIKGWIVVISIFTTPIVGALCTIAFPNRNASSGSHMGSPSLPPI